MILPPLSSPRPEVRFRALLCDNHLLATQLGAFRCHLPDCGTKLTVLTAISIQQFPFDGL
jgi:hypothetical protein